MNALQKLVSHIWHPEPKPEELHKVGEFKADYSVLTEAEIAEPDAECEELFKHSRPVSR